MLLSQPPCFHHRHECLMTLIAVCYWMAKYVSGGHATIIAWLLFYLKIKSNKNSRTHNEHDEMDRGKYLCCNSNISTYLASLQTSVKSQEQCEQWRGQNIMTYFTFILGVLGIDFCSRNETACQH